MGVDEGNIDVDFMIAFITARKSSSLCSLLLTGTLAGTLNLWT
jgi:hypothetical protein